jgi:prophage antirepressor-like protein
MVMPWFCGRDVCEILGYANYRNALAEHIESDCKHQLGMLLEVVLLKSTTNDVRKIGRRCCAYDQLDL